MDTQKQKTRKCSECETEMSTDTFGRIFCPKCHKNPFPKDLYEESFFDLKEYKK